MEHGILSNRIHRRPSHCKELEDFSTYPCTKLLSFGRSPVDDNDEHYFIFVTESVLFMLLKST